MEVFFWGVRGSIPTPGKAFAVYGGNTSCVEVRVNNHVLIFDMGSGIKNLGDSLLQRKINNFLSSQIRSSSMNKIIFMFHFILGSDIDKSI